MMFRQYGIIGICPRNKPIKILSRRKSGGSFFVLIVMLVTYLLTDKHRKEDNK